MKKITILLCLVLIFVTGCSIKTLNTVEIGSNIKTIFSEKAKLYNVHFDGYKYYVPKGLKFLNKDEYNAKFVDRYGNKYYLFVDAISYYHKVENTYEENDKSHYSRRLNYNNKSGYIQIDEQKDGNYIVNFMFNYAKIESYVSKDNLVFAVNNMCYLLRSVKFNDKVLESLIGENKLSYQEETFNLFDTPSNQEDFMDIVSKYEDKRYSKSIDDEQIDLDE